MYFIFSDFAWKNFFCSRKWWGTGAPPFPTALYIYIQNKFQLSQYCRLKSTLKLASHKNYAVFSFDLSADFVISWTIICIYWTLMLTLTYLNESQVFLNLFQTSKLFHYSYAPPWERVEIVIDCGCTKLSSSWFVPIFLKGAVILIYCFRWATTQSSMSLIL